MRRFLVATDLSARSDAAVAQALFLARRLGAALTVLHVVDDDLPSAVFDAARAEALGSLRGTVDRLLAGSDEARVDVHAVGGLDFRVIIDVADREDAALIVLGVHRRDLLKDVLTGTTIERVIRNTTRPVLVVKRPAPGDYVCTLAAVDLVEEAVEVTRAARWLARGHTLYLAHVIGTLAAWGMPAPGAVPASGERHHAATEERCRHLLAGIAERAGLRAGEYLPLVEWKAVVPRLMASARALRADLGVVGTRTRAKDALERFLLGSVAEELLLDMPCDVLAVPLDNHTAIGWAESGAGDR